jgi:hypothetical protein
MQGETEFLGPGSSLHSGRDDNFGGQLRRLEGVGTFTAAPEFGQL